MQYLIVQNRQTVLLGPMDWRPRFIQNEFEDLNIDYRVPLAEPEGYIEVYDANGQTTNIEIFPVELMSVEFDELLYNPAGPFWSYDNNTAVGRFEIVEKPLNEIQEKLKALASQIRYEKESGGTKTTILNQEIQLATSRDLRIIYNDLLNSVGDSTIQFKTSEGFFLELNKNQVQQIYNAVFTFIQQQFLWEKNTIDRINAASTFAELQSILIDIRLQLQY